MAESEPHAKRNDSLQEEDAKKDDDQQASLAVEPKPLSLGARSRPRAGTRPKRFHLGRSLGISHTASSIGSARSVEGSGDGDDIITSMQLPSTTYSESLFSPLPRTPKPIGPHAIESTNTSTVRPAQNIAEKTELEQNPGTGQGKKGEATVGAEERSALASSTGTEDPDGQKTDAEDISPSQKSSKDQKDKTSRDETKEECGYAGGGGHVKEGREGDEKTKHKEAERTEDDEDVGDQLASLKAANTALKEENAQLHDLFNAMNAELEDLIFEDSELQELLAEDVAGSVAPSDTHEPWGGHQGRFDAGSQDEASSPGLGSQGLQGPLAGLVHLVKQVSRVRKWQREQHKAEQSIMVPTDKLDDMNALVGPGLLQSASHQPFQLQAARGNLSGIMVQQTLLESAISDLLDSERALQDGGTTFAEGGEEAGIQGRGHTLKGPSSARSDSDMPEMPPTAGSYDKSKKDGIVARDGESGAGRGDSKTTSVRELQETVDRISDERDEAVLATEQAVSERDVALEERELFSRENEQLRKLLHTLVEGGGDSSPSFGAPWPSMEEDDEGSKSDGDDGDDGCDEGDGDNEDRGGDDNEARQKQQWSLLDETPPGFNDPQASRTPETAKTPKTPKTPRTSEYRQRRQQAFNDARTLLRTPPPPKSPFPLRHIRTSHADYRWQRRRNAGVVGSVLEVLQVFLRLGTAQQWENIAKLCTWLAALCVGNKELSRARGLWFGLWGGLQRALAGGLCQGLQEDGRLGGHNGRPSSTGTSIRWADRVAPPQSRRRRNIHGLSLPLASDSDLPPSSRPSRPTPWPPALPSAPLPSLLPSHLRFPSKLAADFPVEAAAELLISLLVLACFFVAICTAAERRIWMDHNADLPRSYLHQHLLQYRADTGTRTCLSLADYGPLHELLLTFSYQWCVCIPAPFDPRFVTAPLAQNALFWRDCAMDLVGWFWPS